MGYNLAVADPVSKPTADFLEGKSQIQIDD